MTHLRLWLTLAGLILAIGSHAGTMSNPVKVKAGSTATLKCTAKAPDGYITHAFFNFTDPGDAEYLGISYNSSDCYATLYGLSASPKVIKLEVSYAYSYRGSYDNNMHVGSGKYYEYVQVTGAPNPTGVSLSPSESNVTIGETLAVKVNLTPTGAAKIFDYGQISGFSTYGAFDISSDGDYIYLTAKEIGQVYIMVQLSNEEFAIGYYEAIEGGGSGKEPTAISFSVDELTIKEGEKKQLRYSITPAGTSTKLTWSSSNEKVATVSTDGIVKGVKGGTATVKVKTGNGKEASIKVNVSPAVSSISLPSKKTALLGYSVQLLPTLYPENAIEQVTWKSSDTSVVKISSSGYLTGVSEGEATVTCVSESGASAECKVSVRRPNEGFDHHNLGGRIINLQKLATTLLKQKK